MRTLEKDFESLEVGDRFETQGRTVTEADVSWFAALSGDRHPQHTDADWSARSRFASDTLHRACDGPK